MPSLQLSLPIVLYFFSLLAEHHRILSAYLYNILAFLGVIDPVRLLMSILIQPVLGISYQQDYRDRYPAIKSFYASWFQVYGADKIRDDIARISNSMMTWNLLLFQAKLVRTQTPHLFEAANGCSASGNVLDIDGHTITSSSSQKEGAERGFNKKAKGRLCFQLSASWIGRAFVDVKLFAGHCNPKYFFRKAVKRAKSLGLAFEIVRADTAYATLDNLLFLTQLCLGYALGMSSNFSVVSTGIRSFQQLARKNSSAIIPVAKGISLLDLGLVTVGNGVQTNVIIVRRISRSKNRTTDTWKIRTYYYAIASNLNLSPVKLYRFYHQRQCIEAGFKELINHYQFHRLPFQGLKTHEFWLACKVLAMTLFKLFQGNNLPKILHTPLLKTFLGRIVQRRIRVNHSGYVEVVPNTKYTWHLRRLLAHTERIKIALNAQLATC
jgi:hypothetical protein